jgi:hypothetical protein
MILQEIPPMNRSALFLSLLLAAAAPATVDAQASDVRVVIGPELQEQARELGQRDLDRLTAELETTVERAVAKRGGGADGTRLELTLVDAKPSRPTFEQMSRRPGLDMRSVSNGGATIEGVEILPSGETRPVHFSWYETDIRWAQGRTTWTDAHRAFDLFANRYAKGER